MLLLLVFVNLGWAGDAQWIEIDRAGALSERALTIWGRSREKKARISRPTSAAWTLLRESGAGRVAEALSKKAIQNDEKGLPPDSRDLASDFESLGKFYSFTENRRRRALAEPRARYQNESPGSAAEETRQTMHGCETTLRLLNRSPEAEKVEGQTKATPDDAPPAISIRQGV